MQKIIKTLAILTAILFVVMVVGGIVLFLKLFPKAPPIELPTLEQIQSFTATDTDGDSLPFDQTDLEALLFLLEDAKPTRILSVNDFPAGQDYYALSVRVESRTITYYFYEDDADIFAEIPYTGIYRINPVIYTTFHQKSLAKP